MTPVVVQVPAVSVSLHSILQATSLIAAMLRVYVSVRLVPSFLETGSVAGAFASRAMVADVALPGIFTRVKGLRLDESEPVRIGGWAFRGLLNLPVVWDAT